MIRIILKQTGYALEKAVHAQRLRDPHSITHTCLKASFSIHTKLQSAKLIDRDTARATLNVEGWDGSVPFVGFEGLEYLSNTMEV